jgi:hypothetical protein
MLGDTERGPLPMEIIFLTHGAMSLVLLVVHLADYFLNWPAQPFAVGRPPAPIEGPDGVASSPLPERYSYDRAA